MNNKLYIVSTPIGNLKDITLRAIDILKEVDIIFCEDTRVSSILLKEYGINKRLMSYHDFNQEITTKIVSFIKDGNNIALISDAGTPLVSDPGYKLVRECIKNNIKVEPICGISAFLSAFIVSGFSYPFLFYGFLSHKENLKLKQLQNIKYLKTTTIFYESIHKIENTLKCMYDVLKDRNIMIGREISKKYETFYYFNIKDYKEYLSELTKGELVICIEKYDDLLTEEVDYLEFVLELIKCGYKSADAVKEISKLYNIDKKELYLKFAKYNNK